ncbi:MAG: ATP synthase F0 subunit A [Bacteroidales bacterium]|nr:MAG: ATP synthase F0 subunit A [Bacteroidales bacterium]
MRRRLFIGLFILTAISLGGYQNVFASTQEKEKDATHNEGEKAKFNTVDFIFEHIGDSYEWHVLTIGHTHVSIPLPMILYSEQKGLNIFLSSKFHHGAESYKGFKWEHEGKYKGKIVELNDNGEILEENPLPWNFSITKLVLSIFIASTLLCWIFISIARKYKSGVNKAPTGIQNLFEPIILFVVNDIAIPSIGEKKYQRFLPFLLTVFFFIWFNNMLGLIPIFPGGANVTGNIAVTMVLALFTFVIVTINGNKNYWGHIVNTPGVPWFLKLPIPIMFIVEFAGILTKPIVLMIRLFANILAGHMVAIVFFSLIFIFGGIAVWAGYTISIVSVSFSFFMTLLELLVALIQAYVFTLLSAIYIGMATEEHHH